MNAKHSSASPEWYTPDYILNAVRAVLGGIDFDPASCEAANWRVKAKKYHTKEHNALGFRWNVQDQTVFINPPGGKTGTQSNTLLFWDKLTTHRSQIKDAIFLAFSIEALQTTQKLEYPMARFPVCIPGRRIRFLREEGFPGPSPTHSSAIVYLPGRRDRTDAFVNVFSDLGVVLNG